MVGVKLVSFQTLALNSQQQFFTHIREQHPDPDNFADFIKACNRPLRKSLRVNTLKISVADFKILAAKRNWILAEIPWCDEGFWVSNADPDEPLQLGNSGEHLLGLFYIQEASSMLPPVALLNQVTAAELTPDFVLDLAAAPGSKTTQLAAIMNNQGSILANELSASRLKVLHANLQRCGVINTCLSHFDGVALDQSLLGAFDAILVDAPCGGEGTYRKDPNALANWSAEAMTGISRIQKQLLFSAWNMLKPGGRLVYSTCTLSREENHAVIAALHKEVGVELNIINLGDLFKDAAKAVTQEGFLHVWPEIFDCEGFFVACLEKQASATRQQTTFKLKAQSPFKPLDDKRRQLVEEYYLQQFGFELTAISSRLMIRSSHNEEQVWLFPPEGVPLREVMRIQRCGVRVCDLIEGRKGMVIRTKHEFVISFATEFKTQTVELNADQASACFRGENINLQAVNNLQKGEAVMLFQAVPLGLAKVISVGKHSKLKNNLARDLLRTNANFQD